MNQISISSENEPLKLSQETVIINNANNEKDIFEIELKLDNIS